MDDPNQTKLIELFGRYRQLTAFCDRFADQVGRMLPREIHCAPGCCACCELSSVNALEAAVLWAALTDRPSPTPDGSAACPLLAEGLCSIYAARPLICRTHGMALRMVIGAEVTLHHCPRNFPGHSPGQLAGSGLLLDETLITTNLSRLNMAFCMLIGQATLSARRFALAAICAGQLERAVARAAALLNR